MSLPHSKFMTQDSDCEDITAVSPGRGRERHENPTWAFPCRGQEEAHLTPVALSLSGHMNQPTNKGSMK